MRYFFLLLIFIANLSATTSGRINRWVISQENAKNEYRIKQKGQSENPPLSFFDNYTVEDTTEDTVDENEVALEATFSQQQFFNKHAFSEKKCPLSKQKIRQRIALPVPIFIRDSQFLI